VLGALLLRRPVFQHTLRLATSTQLTRQQGEMMYFFLRSPAIIVLIVYNTAQ
jgi:hypothetical protein